MRRVHLSASEARRIALASQGFDRDRPSSRPDARHFRRVVNTLGLLQLDFVNVLVPAHMLVLWSRLGAYDRERFLRYAYTTGEVTEQWAHEASIVPASSWPLLEHRRRGYRLHKNNPLRRLRNRHAYLDAVLEQVRADGAVTASQVATAPGPKPRRKPGDWHRSTSRWALEYHFARGSLAVAHRLPNFQRVYDLPERIIPAEYLQREVSQREASKQLLRQAATALGVATLHDLADYYRMSPRDCAPLVQELVEAGDLYTVDVEAWRDQAYLAPTARLPRRIGGASLLSPFDPVVWFRPRAERMFDFHYRIEIYVPAAMRKWGYYVLPFRVGDEIVARVDLKADRQTGCLLVRGAHPEHGVEAGGCLERLLRELGELRDWLGLEEIHVARHNSFSRRLAASL